MNTPFTVVYTKNTSTIQIQGPAAYVDRAEQQLNELWRAYITYLDEGTILPPPEGAEGAAKHFRYEPYSDYLNSVLEEAEEDEEW